MSEVAAPTTRDRYRGALLGLAAGDAVGTTVEFRAPGSFASVTDMVGGGPFRLPAGAWTDDTSMACCLAESLIDTQAFDPADQLTRYVSWYRDRLWSSTGSCFDIGNATRAALERFEQTGEPFPGDAFPDAGGNGPLMKLAPVPMAFAHDLDEAVTRAAESARTTHGLPAAIDATRCFAAMMVTALCGAGKDEVTADPGLDLHPEVAAVAAGSFTTKQPPEIRGTGYAVAALEASLWAFHTTSSYEDAVLSAANLGDDADTTAAICGQLAGAHYGVDAIPERWRTILVRHGDIVALADRLLELAGG